MKESWIISDLHFGHQNIIEYSKRPFETAEEMDETIIQNWNEMVNPYDRVYLLGDVAMARRNICKLGRLNGKIILVMGNHDIYPTKDYLPYIDDIRGFVVSDRIICSHIPLYKGSDHGVTERFIGNIHGHTHENNLSDPFYLNVSIEQLDYKPMLFEEAKNILKERNKLCGKE